MSVFVDTSALLAVLAADDDHHSKAASVWSRLLSSDEILVCSNYIVVETVAVAQQRLGPAAARVFLEDVMPALVVHWVDIAIHAAAVAAMLIAGRRNLSLVDCSSFEIMRRLGIRAAFAFDRHFKEQGFEVLT